MRTKKPYLSCHQDSSSTKGEFKLNFLFFELSKLWSIHHALFCCRIKCLLLIFLNVRLKIIWHATENLALMVSSHLSKSRGVPSQMKVYLKKISSRKTWNIFILIDRRKSVSQLAPLNFKRFFFSFFLFELNFFLTLTLAFNKNFISKIVQTSQMMLTAKYIFFRRVS